MDPVNGWLHPITHEIEEIAKGLTKCESVTFHIHHQCTHNEKVNNHLTYSNKLQEQKILDLWKKTEGLIKEHFHNEKISEMDPLYLFVLIEKEKTYLYFDETFAFHSGTFKRILSKVGSSPKTADFSIDSTKKTGENLIEEVFKEVVLREKDQLFKN